ncbi:MAG: UDP-glucose--hexose-1-phosphate uridylyltransferase [Clostridia bacterium]|nr:UDP-glucose--hexose-1-phosphate uridylyltransferase [Clostridia bacterium]
MKTIQDNAVAELVEYGVRTKLIEEEDRAFATASIMQIMAMDDISPEKTRGEPRALSEILSDLCDAAFEKGLFESNTVVYRDLFDTKLMGALVQRPSDVIAKFESLYKDSPKQATDYFYKLACDSNYIRRDRIAKDLKWKVSSEYGEIDITVNLSKPEKDPKAIAAAKLLPQSGFPKCLLCHENEGYAGTLSKPARQNLRQIPFDMAGTPWFLQYSPYVYYNEHCIALSSEHTPMKIDRSSFEKLLGFVTHFPHYFIGSNADLPIVGGSILSHDHMQGGRYTFAMENAGIDTPVVFSGFEDIKAGIVKWPMSVIRLVGADKERLVELADKILVSWRDYTDEAAFIYKETDGTPHNTITPIARRRGKDFELDLVLRNNITTQEHPLGVYHPHAEHHNIKKENIGLIEVMGLAVLPARLKDEIEDMKSAVISGTPFAEIESIKKHEMWFDSFKNDYHITPENIDGIIKTEIGKTFVRVLCDAGVYKDTEEGRAAFLRFIASVNEK